MNYSITELDFTGVLKEDRIRRLAESDLHNVVSQVQEVFGDFYPINKDLFTLNIEETSGLMTQQYLKWSIFD